MMELEDKTVDLELRKQGLDENHNEDIKDSMSPSSASIKSDDLSALEKNVLPKETAKHQHEPSPAPITRTTYLAFAAMCVVDLTEALDATSIAVVLPAIATSLHATTTPTFLLATNFLLCSTIFQPPFHTLSVSFGRKPILLLSLTVFLLGALIGGFAPSIQILLAGRIVQGIGAAGSITLTVVVVTDLVPLRNRAPWLAVLNVMWAVGSVSGPVIGGAFVDVNWRWILWLNIPLVITSFTGLCFFLHLQQPFPGSSIVGKLAPLDYIGTVLFLVSSTAFLLPITLAGTIAPWTSAPILVPFLLGLVGLILFFLYQRHLAHSSNPKTSPLIRLSVFSNRTTAIGHGGTFIHGILLWMILYYLPLYYEGVLGYSPLHAGIAAFPETFTVAPAAIVAGLTISRLGTYQWMLRVGWVLTTVGMGLLCLLSSTTPTYQWILINLVPGIALGMLVPAGGTAIQAATNPADAGHAISMFYMIRGCGQTVGVAVGSTVFRYQLADVLSHAGAASIANARGKSGRAGAEATVEGLLRILGGLKESGGDSEELIEGIVRALRVVWGVGCALAGLAAVASWWMREYSLDRTKVDVGKVGGNGGKRDKGVIE